MAAAAADSINQSSSSTSHTRKQGKLRSSALEDSENFSLGTQEIFRDNLLSGFHKPTKMHFKNFIIFITNCMRHPLSTCNGKKKKKKKKTKSSSYFDVEFGPDFFLFFKSSN
jgi:hypothetical protein